MKFIALFFDIVHCTAKQILLKTNEGLSGLTQNQVLENARISQKME